MPLLTVKDLCVSFHTRTGVVRAVDRVSFTLNPGETLGIVGESGSGKSVTALSLLRLLPIPPARIAGASVQFDGIDLLTCPGRDLRAVRGKRIAMIFQDPMTALNPYMRIGDQVVEAVTAHESCPKAKARALALEALESVGIPDAARRFGDYPHEFSGGMRQRVMIAMALITRPDLLIADEPTTALDVTVQAQILELIKELQAKLGMAVILITHDLGVVAGVCDRVNVMYAGSFVECANTAALFANPRHPYTEALMRSLPSTHVKGEELQTIPGMPPDLTESFDGCPLAPRCAHAAPACHTTPPQLLEVDPGHQTACTRVQMGEL